MRAGVPINLERSELPKAERAKLNSPSLSCVPASVESTLYFAVFAMRHFQRHFAVVLPSSSVPSRSSPVLPNNRPLEVLAGSFSGLYIVVLPTVSNVSRPNTCRALNVAQRGKTYIYKSVKV